MAEALHLGAKAGARAVCVLVHGRGQSPEEMQSHILARLAVPDVTFVLPRAPDGTWYAAKAVDPLTTDTRAALALALDHLAADIAAARALHPGLPLVLAGFSQGACLSLEYAFAGLPAPEALVALTGCRVGVLADDRRRALAPDLPVWLTGSDNDPWIPVEAFAEAALELGRGRARLRAALYPGRGHEVSDPEIAMLHEVLDGIHR
ncbi:alpha/beta hydrolase [Pseudogemmobacter sonorensis]|uniref:alpha/beta hydrolase n=1 Tax=Pseudogemmobacter sonorensis TaxID=2989681 RepID=UPI003673A334